MSGLIKEASKQVIELVGKQEQLADAKLSLQTMTGTNFSQKILLNSILRKIDNKGITLTEIEKFQAEINKNPKNFSQYQMKNISNAFDSLKSVYALKDELEVTKANLQSEVTLKSKDKPLKSALKLVTKALDSTKPSRLQQAANFLSDFFTKKNQAAGIDKVLSSEVPPSTKERTKSNALASSAASSPPPTPPMNLNAQEIKAQLEATTNELGNRRP